MTQSTKTYFYVFRVSHKVLVDKNFCLIKIRFTVSTHLLFTKKNCTYAKSDNELPIANLLSNRNSERVLFGLYSSKQSDAFKDSRFIRLKTAFTV